MLEIERELNDFTIPGEKIVLPSGMVSDEYVSTGLI
jgi:hypothetical protein